ncbi:ferritin-like protein [Mesorhizobium sp. M0848]|uniref:ferritin-like domain-containing protein n=1 Tax=Mesorhizobium sp. M0848 TaxID=2957012 RepID=UPI003338B38D
MLRIQASPITDLTGLRAALQQAIQLEHSTIPPYLCALLTLSGNSDAVRYARRLIRDIVLEEMLHMSLACNIVNAIGGTPEINRPGLQPIYPGPLPMGIAGGVEVHLKRYSRALVRDVFMQIEEPELPLDIPVLGALPPDAASGPRTIGEFYAAIRHEIVRQTDAIFTGDPARQVTTGRFDASEEFVVSNVETALRAIETIVEQGEGTPQSPFDLQQDIAHYYRFQELEKGMKLVGNPGSPLKVGFDPAQPLVIDDDADVIKMVDNPQLVAIDISDAQAVQLSNECDRLYSRMLDELQMGFSGEPDKVDTAVETMQDFAGVARDLLAQQLTAGPQSGFFAGPRFRYSAA